MKSWPKVKLGKVQVVGMVAAGNVFLPTIWHANDVGHVGKNKWKYLFFDFLKGHLFPTCQIQN